MCNKNAPKVPTNLIVSPDDDGRYTTDVNGYLIDLTAAAAAAAASEHLTYHVVKNSSVTEIQ